MIISMQEVRRSIMIVTNKKPYRNIKEILINISIEEIKSIGISSKKFDSGNEDYLFYEPYELTIDQVKEIEKITSENLEVDFSKFIYVLACEQAIS